MHFWCSLRAWKVIPSFVGFATNLKNRPLKECVTLLKIDQNLFDLVSLCDS